MDTMLLVDGDCGFCMRSADWARRRVRPAVPLVPYQQVDIAALGLTEGQCQTAVQWVEGGRVTAAGGRAVCRTLATAPAPWPTISALMSLPVADRLVDACYRLVAANRHRLPGSTAACEVSAASTPAA